VTAALAAYAAGQATEHAVITAVAAARLLVPVVAVPVDPAAVQAGPPPGDPGTAQPDNRQPHPGERHGGGQHPRGQHPRGQHPGGQYPGGQYPGGQHPGGQHVGESHGGEKETEMALPTLIGNDGRKAVIAFTGTETITRWRADARPVPVPAARLWPAVAAEQADAVVIDVAGPVPIVIEGARLAALADGAEPPPPHLDPDVRAQVAAVTPDFTLGPGGPDAELTVTLTAAGPASVRAAAEAIAARLAPRFRRGIAFRAG
jgi:SseB protein N-terminal domain